MLLVVGILLFLILLGIAKLTDSLACIVCTAILGMALIVGIIAFVINPADVRAEIKGFEAVRTTIELARARGDNVENTALMLQVMQYNAWLAEQQHWNRTVWGAWIPDEIDALQPIQ